MNVNHGRAHDTAGDRVAEGDLQLVSPVESNGFMTGALQVLLDGEFGAVCNAGFDSVDAAVACRQLGFAEGGFALTSFFRGGSMLPDLQVQQVYSGLICPCFSLMFPCDAVVARVSSRSSACPVGNDLTDVIRRSRYKLRGLQERSPRTENEFIFLLC